MPPAKNSRSHPEPLLEGLRHVLRVLHAAAIGDGGEREVGLLEQRLHTGKPHPHDLLARRPADRSFHLPLERSSRQTDPIDHLRHRQPVTGMFANEPHSCRHFLIGDRHDVARLPRHDAPWRHHHRLGWLWLTADEAVEEGRRLVADAVTIEGYEYRGRPYKSLSAIAKAITGVKWNGWVFFGLKSAGSGT